jgi:branched-chain amino acid transport system substrate-binding protein
MKKYAIVTLALIGSMALSSTLAQNLKVIKVATLTPLSGGQSSLGEAIKNGAELALNAQKAAFAKLGFDLQLAPNDDQALPDVGTAAARRIASDRSILAVVGTLNSGVAIPSSAVLKDDNVAMVSPANTANAATDRGLANYNRIVARDDAQGPAGADFMIKTLKTKKAFVINDKTAYGAGLATEVVKYLKSKNVQVLGDEGTEEKSNFQPLIIKIKALNPDTIYFGGIYDQIGVFLKQLRAAGVNTPVMGGDGLDDNQLITIGGDGAKNTYFTTVAAPASEFPKAAAMVAAYKTAYGKDAAGFSVTGYDAMNVALAGIKKAIGRSKDVPSRASVQDAIRKISYAGLSGSIKFNSVGDRVTGQLFVVQVTNDLKFKVSGTVRTKAPKA